MKNSWMKWKNKCKYCKMIILKCKTNYRKQYLIRVMKFKNYYCGKSNLHSKAMNYKKLLK